MYMCIINIWTVLLGHPIKHLLLLLNFFYFVRILEENKHYTFDLEPAEM